MKRTLDQQLLTWKADPGRKPLLLRGARQVGKTYAVRQLSVTYLHFVEVNFELIPAIEKIFEVDLYPDRILRDLSALIKKPIDPATTLLFFDEIQLVPQALTALRYFYERMPELHIIAAGSLLDFAIEQVGIPVGRVTSLYMYPMSFMEFLQACDEQVLCDAILNHNPQQEISAVLHEKALRLVGEYLAVGGMPEAVNAWSQKNAYACFKVHATLIDTYKQDFNKYAKEFQLKYLNLLLKYIPLRLGKKFKFSEVSSEYRKRDLSPCLDLLMTAGIAHPIYNSAGQGKAIFLDIALSQTILDGDLQSWILDPFATLVNKGEVTEAFVGQELLAYANPQSKADLYYWSRSARNSQAEIDYLTQREGKVVPIEVKSGLGSTLKSMHSFLESHSQSTYGIRFSTQNYSVHNNIHSYPLYAVMQVMQR